MQIMRLIASAVLLLMPSDADATVKACSEAVVQVQSGYPDLAEATVSELAARVENLYPRLAVFFGHDAPKPINIHLSDDHQFSVAYTHSNTIGFPRHIIDGNMAVVAHEMTHLFMPVRNSAALGEGIAIYVQDWFGSVGGYPNFGQDVDALLLTRLTRANTSGVATFDDAEGVISRRGTWRGFGRGARRDAYLLAGSFTRYLFDVVLQGDMGAFKRIYADMDFKRETGTSLRQIEAAWRANIGLPVPNL